MPRIVAAAAFALALATGALAAPQLRWARDHSHSEAEVHGRTEGRRSALPITNTNSIAIGASQFTPLSGASPSETLKANANEIVSIATNATNSAPSTTTLEVLSFPEFALLGPNTEFSALCPSLDVNKTLLAPYCESIPKAAIGALVDCSAPDATTVPYKIIACGLMVSSPLTKQLVVSYNTCQRNEDAPTDASPSFYNSQVIVGGGRVLAVYPKYHPFFTSCFATPTLELTTFQTLRSNVTFGVFTCFDILFSSPKQDLVDKGVKFFSYSAAIPMVFKMAVELFSKTNNVTVAASNMNGDSSVIVNGTPVGTSNDGGVVGCPSTVGPTPCVTYAIVPLY